MTVKTNVHFSLVIKVFPDIIRNQEISCCSMILIFNWQGSSMNNKSYHAYFTAGMSKYWKIGSNQYLNILKKCKILKQIIKYSMIFKASALWVDAFNKLICPSVCPCVRLFVCSCVHFWYTVLTSFCPHFLKSDVHYFLEIQNPWGKVMERSGLRFEHFCL